ncbi:hypothetical protein [Salinibaculum salinum]|uniref:ABC transporter substrate-binding protein n=1 Tax=Salinibaculum salinum TaxID=3131996 RepID=UPI0030EB8DF6
MSTEDRAAESGPPESGRDHASGLSRRAFVATGAALSVGTFAGCSGGGSEPDNPSTDEAWTTDGLLEEIDGDETITIYAGTGDDQQWYDLVDVINDEFGTSLGADVVASDGGTVSQRFIQEREANNEQVDVLSSVSNVQDEIKNTGMEDGEEAANDVASEYFEMGVDENFWFKDVLEDWHLLPFMVPGFNGGTKITFPYNKDIFDDQGADVPEEYGDLLDDQYEGMTMLVPGYVVRTYAGWAISKGANETDMGEMEWMDALRENVEFKTASSHTSATREIANGNAAMMLYNFPNTVEAFITDSPALGAAFPSGGMWPASGGPLFINKNAPNPGVARFFVSAVLEEPVQKRILGEVYTQVPVRLDLDYSDVETNPYSRRRIEIDSEKIGFYDTAQYTTITQTALEEEKFDT